MTTMGPLRDEARASSRGEDIGLLARGAVGAASAPLVRNAGRSTPAGQAADRRARRTEAYRLRTRLWELSTLERVRACGRVTHHGGGGPVLRVSGDGEDRQAGLAGLVTCGSVWSCPTCSRKIGAERADELRQVVQATADHGGSAGLITLTARHHAGQSLRDCWDAITFAWQAVTAGKRHQQEQAAFDQAGWCRATEVTHGESGWHVHLHVLVVFASPTSPEMMQELASRWFGRWESALERWHTVPRFRARAARSGARFSAIAESGGLDVRPVQMTASTPDAIANYFTKVAFEVVSQSTKDGRMGNRTPMRILADGLSTGLVDDLELWWTWEQVSRGRRQMTWSRDLRRWAGVGPRKTDEEIAEQDHKGQDVLAIAPESWPAVRDHVAELLDVAERDGVAGAQMWLARKGARWLSPRHRE